MCGPPFCSMKITEHERANGRDRVDNQQDCPEGEL